MSSKQTTYIAANLE